MSRFPILALGLLAIIVSLVPSSAFADLATITVWPGDNWISAPLVPFNPTPTAVFAGLDLNGNLRRWDMITGEIITYDAAHPEVFGNILLGEGYMLSNSGSSAISATYDGVPDGVPDQGGEKTDMWIALPGLQYDGSNAGGMHWIGHPFIHTVSIQSCVVTDGSVLLSIQEAVDRGWLDGLWATRDNQAQASRTAGLALLSPDDTFLRATGMYQITTHRDNLALIVPAPEPCSMIVLACGVGVLAFRRRRR